MTVMLVAVVGAAKAQFPFGKIGSKVTKAVVKEVHNQIKENQQQKRQEQMQQQQQPASHQQPASQPQQKSQQPVAQKSTPAKTNVAVVDNGQNVKRQSGLDYIDEYGINHGGGILIDSVLWAPVNCGYHATNYPYGKLYQWGRKHGQGYAAPFVSEKANVKPDAKGAEIVPAPVTPAMALKYPNRFYARSDMSVFNWTTNDLDLWNRTTDDCKIYKNTAYDPCPKGWKLPDLFDFYCLAKNYSKLTEHNGQLGRWLSGNTPYSTEVQRIFLPLAGAREREGSARARHVYGLYWSGRHGGGEGLVWHLQISDSGVDVNPHAYPHEAFSVRCVKDIPGQRVR